MEATGGSPTPVGLNVLGIMCHEIFLGRFRHSNKSDKYQINSAVLFLSKVMAEVVAKEVANCASSLQKLDLILSVFTTTPQSKAHNETSGILNFA